MLPKAKKVEAPSLTVEVARPVMFRGAGFRVRVVVLEVAAYSESPAKAAVRSWLPTKMPVRSALEKRATPLAFVAALPTGEPLIEKTTFFPTRGMPAVLRVAESVA